MVAGEEEKVKERVMHRLQEEYAVVVPKRKLKARRGDTWKVDTRVLFPGYILIDGT